MATPVSIAIKRDAAQARIQQASIELAAKYGVGEADLSPHHKQPDIQNVMVLEAVAAFLERLVAQPIAPTHVAPKLAQEPPKPAPTPRKA